MTDAADRQDDESGDKPARTPLRVLRRGVMLLFLGVAGAAVILIGLLLVYQRSLIYFPEKYDKAVVEAEVRRGLRRVPFATDDGAQVAYFVGRKDGQPFTAGTPLWVMFHGNASVALHWLYFLENYPGTGEAFLLVDYPGYGECDGKPTAEGIRASVSRVLPALEKVLSLEAGAAESNLGAFGYSIGCAAALEFTAHHPVRRVVLMAPFTSLKAAARRVVGWPLCELTRDRLDNVSALRAIAAKTDKPTIHIFHGTRDPVVPHSHGRELAGLHPDIIEFREIAGADHETVFEQAVPAIREVMQDAVQAAD